MTHTFIDIHHHVIGKNSPAASGRDPWNMNIDAHAMDDMGITGALLSLPIASTKEQTHNLNTLLAELASYDTKRYGILASLPLADADATFEEIEYASDRLKADGFIVPTNIDGVYIGDDRFDEIWSELDKRSAVILLHPTKPQNGCPDLLVKDLSVYEYPFDTTRSMMDFIYRGKHKAYPNIRWILSHAGGTIPYLAYRLSAVAEESKAVTQTSGEILNALQNLHYDVALSTSHSVVAMLKETVGPSQILFGTDYPLRPQKGTAQSVEQLCNHPSLNETQLRAVKSENAKTLFPRFA